MDTTIQLVLPAQQYERLAEAAGVEKLPMPQIALLAVEEWLERWSRIDRARQLVRDMCADVDLIQPDTPNDVARNHDAYLYSRRAHEHSLR